jgi:hypothetical protein
MSEQEAPGTHCMSQVNKDDLLRWLASGRRGISSNTIVTHLTGIDAIGDWGGDVPHDPADLDRCLQLLKAVPDLRPMLRRMATYSQQWRALIERWDEVEACHLDEVGLGWTKAKSAPKTYALMRSVLDTATGGAHG